MRQQRTYFYFIAGIVLLAMVNLTEAGASDRAPRRQEQQEAPLKATEVFVPGDGHYPHYRIPSLVTTNAGTLLAFCEGRQGGDHSKNDMVLKRSADDGKTWGPLQVLDDRGGDCLNNPQSVVLRESGRVLLMYNMYPEGHHEREVVPGYEGKYCHTFLMHSDDDGLTWTKPREISRQVKRPTRVTSVASGPGIGIQLTRGKHQGRIIMPFNQGPFGDWMVYAAYSDDEGETWRFGETAPHPPKGRGNEVQMVELSDGQLLLNSRGQDANRLRLRAHSRDGSLTWSALENDPQLPEPQCMGSIIRHSWPEDGRSRILFSGPGHKEGRSKGRIYLSYDEGKTWPISRQLVPDEFSYSCLTVLPDKSIGCLYEGAGGIIRFARVELAWLTGGAWKGTNEGGATHQRPPGMAERRPRPLGATP
jgi:sialidase-1